MLCILPSLMFKEIKCFHDPYYPPHVKTLSVIPSQKDDSMSIHCFCLLLLVKIKDRLKWVYPTSKSSNICSPSVPTVITGEEIAAKPTMLKQINEIKDFLLTARRGRDAHSVKIKRSKDMFKFKQSLPPGFQYCWIWLYHVYCNSRDLDESVSSWHDSGFSWTLRSESIIKSEW
ncbi:unnamed protein product [Vicia faba]|uniref:Uncharacterized protein n=1 Tax=Vicia faba TaxID=3906 RepID=A0AAV0ZF15_VICFA|nr:unnamed protein product [Vicia faba]